MLLQCKDVDVNAKIYTSNVPRTIFEYMCENEQKTTLGVELLLNDRRTKVNEGEDYTPLYLALQNVEREEDYFYKVTQLLLSHYNGRWPPLLAIFSRTLRRRWNWFTIKT